MCDIERECHPGGEVVAHDDALLRTRDVPWPWANGVGWVRWDDADLKERVAATLTFFRERGRPVSWYVGPSSTPRGRAEELRRAGLREHTPWLLATRLPVSDLPINPSLVVAEVREERDMEAALKIEFPDWDGARRARALRERMATLACPSSRTGYLIAQLNGEAVGYASWRYASNGQSVQLICGVTRPPFRRQHVLHDLASRADRTGRTTWDQRRRHGRCRSRDLGTDPFALRLPQRWRPTSANGSH